jgi:hypothetical protein
MYRVRMDPVFAMAESFFLDGGSRLDDVKLVSLALVSERRSVACLDSQISAEPATGGRGGEKVCQWSGGVVPLRGGVITGHW